MDMKLSCISNKVFFLIAQKHLKCNRLDIDENLYVLCNLKSNAKFKKFFNLKNQFSSKKYTVAVIFTNDVDENNIYVSESTKFNVLNYLNLKNSNSTSSFSLASTDSNEFTSFASEVKISLICSGHDCTSDLINNLLKNYFSLPKYLRTNDIFRIKISNYVPEGKYHKITTDIDILHFKVNSMKIAANNVVASGAFVVFGQTALVQETNIKSYLPKKCQCNFYFDQKLRYFDFWLPALKTPSNQLELCLAPFLQDKTFINVKPVFLVEGPNGSGKYRIIKMSARRLGLNVLQADFAEVQSLTSAQTEAKLRIIIQNAEICAPCILVLRNIQIFGLNADGQKDHRVLATFGSELNKLYNKKFKYPVIIVATCTDFEIQVELEKLFIEKIHFGYLKQKEKLEILSFIVKSRGISSDADFKKISTICSDFGLSDLEALVGHATKRLIDKKIKKLSTCDFINSIEYMQSVFADKIGAPRVPTVHWEDIGGLVDLKREIKRRIQVAQIITSNGNIGGLGRSGLLLYGPPGTGKTLLAKAVATECQLNFLSVKGPELLNMYVGQSEKNVRQVFGRARAAAPCIIFFDELDSLAPKRGQSGDSGGVMDRVVSQLLAEMDGLERAGGIFIVGATNRPDLLDPALLRPGRFDKMLYVGVYTEPESQLSVLNALTKRFKLEENGAELNMLPAELPEYPSGADLYSVCSGAWLRAVRRLLLTADKLPEMQELLISQHVIVKHEDFLAAIKDLVPSFNKEELQSYEKFDYEFSTRLYFM